MNILIFNCGSSSQGFKVYEIDESGNNEIVISGKGKNVATQTQAEAVLEWKLNGNSGSKATRMDSHRQAAEQILDLLVENHIAVDAVGHRFVHGATLFSKSVKIDARVMEDLQKVLPFAPIHNPNSYSVIKVCMEKLPGIPQYAVFDTAFHATMSEVARTYALPYGLAEAHGYHKYGFHGLSYQYISARIAELMARPLQSLKLILCHLGTGGSSVAAMKDGKTLDTSMGYSPLQGLVMSTRCGDIDAEVALDLVRQGNSPDEVSRLLNNQSGLIGLSGYSSNLQEVIEAAEKGNARCQLAYDVYVRRLQSYLGAYTWLLDGADAIGFTDDVGLKAWKMREKVCGHLHNLGVELDIEANRQAPSDRAACISTHTSRTQLWVVPTDEEGVILNEVKTLMGIK